MIKNVITVFFILLASVSFSQKMKITQGDYKFLKGEKELNLEMDYSSMKFYKKNLDEKAYIDKRMDDITDDKGKQEAEKWRKDWEYSKNTTFVSKFLASINKKSPIQVAENNLKAKYTLIVKTVWIYPGWFGGVMEQPAKVTTLLKFVETQNPDRVLLEIKSKDVVGTSYIGVPNNNDRIAEGYAKTGKSLGKRLSKKVK